LGPFIIKANGLSYSNRDNFNSISCDISDARIMI